MWRQTAGAPRRIVVVAIPLLLLPAVAAGCSNKQGSSAGSATAPAPEERRASDAAVAAGLRKIDQIARGIAGSAAADKAAAQALADDLAPSWEPVEGTVKANDPDAYITFEDNLARLQTAVRRGSASMAKTASEAVSKVTADYLGKHPG